MFPIWMDAPQQDVRDLVVVDEGVWVVDAAGVHSRDREGAVVSRFADLPGPVLCAGPYQGKLTVGTEDGAYRWNGSWVAVGPRRAVVAVTESHLVFRSGQILGPEGMSEVDGSIRLASEWAGELIVALADGGLILPWGRIQLEAPAADLAVVGGELRVATHASALRIVPGQEPVRLDIPATSAGTMWGTADGRLVDDQGQRVLAIDGPVDAMARVSGALWVAGPEGLWVVSEGAQRITPRTSMCGDHVTGITRWKGEIVIGTFDRGACIRAEDGSWRPVSGLPSTMVNDVMAQGEVLWVATAEGLVRVDAGGPSTIGRSEVHTNVGAPGLHHHGANDLSVGPGGKLWIADLFGPIEVLGSKSWRRWRLHVSGRSYQTLAACDDGSVWVGSEDDGLAVLGTALGRRNGRSSWRHVNVSDGLPQDWVMAVACAGPGSAWVGTYNRGVGRLSHEGYESVKGLEQAWVQDLAVHGNALWVATAGGLFRVENGVSTSIMQTDVHTLYAEADGLWVGAASGLWWIPDGSEHPVEHGVEGTH